MSRLLIVAGLVGVAIASFAGCQATRAGYETAPYRVLQKDGRVELRDYPTLHVAETRQGGDDFMRLFRYISRDNAAEQKIAMTTPVFMSEGGGGQRTMAFVLPGKLSSPPSPKNEQVAVRELPGGTFAVLRFRGGRQGPGGEALARLRTWLKEHQKTAVGEPMFAYFDPPWTPAFLRRNEVMLRLQPQPQP